MKGYITSNGHAIPIDDEVEHCPYDWCECDPELWVLNGEGVWIHIAADQRYLIEQAECIKACYSFDMFIENKHLYKDIKTQPYPFTDRSYLVLPHSAKRKGLGQEEIE